MSGPIARATEIKNAQYKPTLEELDALLKDLADIRHLYPDAARCMDDMLEYRSLLALEALMKKR
jgi:hypothetical protein